MWKSCLVTAISPLILFIAAYAQESSGSMAPAVMIHTVSDQIDTSFIARVWNSGDAVLEATVVPVRRTWTAVDWLQPTPTTLSIPPGGNDSITVTIRRSLLPASAPGTVLDFMEGFVLVVVAPPTATDTLGTFVRINPNESYLQYDTVSTSCLSLVVGSNGNLGNKGSDNQGGANMNFMADCAQSETIPGDASIYLFDASPVVYTSPTSGTWSMYAGLHEFLPIDHVCWGTGVFSGSNYEAYYGGPAYTRDSLLELETIIFAPTAPNSCEFLIYRMQYCSPTATSLTDLTLGFVADWDIPSDSQVWNSAGVDPFEGAYWQRGAEFDEPSGDALECQQNNARFGGLGLIAYETVADGLVPQTEPAGARFEVFGSIIEPGSDLDSTVLYSLLHAGSAPPPTDSTNDLVTLMTIFDSYDLPGTETLTVWLALGAVENGTEADMSGAIADARAWFWDNNPLPSVPAGCGPACIYTGDVNQDGQTNLTDLTIMVNCLFVTFECQYIAYMPAANTSGDQNCDINLTDLTALVNSLFVTFEELPLCTSFDYTLCF